MTDKVSAIIVNFNAGCLLNISVNSLLNCPDISEIILVDNASSDSSLDTVRENPQLKIIENSSNLGFASACNIGLQHIQNDYVLFFNPDCLLSPDALANMLACLKSDINIGMVGGFLIHPDGSEQAGGRRAVPTPWRSFVRAFGLYHFEHRWPKLFFDFYLHNQTIPT